MEEFDLQPGEHVVLKVRQHVFVLVLKLIPFAVLAFIPFILAGLLGFVASVPTSSEAFIAQARSFAPAAIFITGAWWLFVWLGAFMVLMRYALTVWIITNIRIIDIKQYGFFSRKVSSFLLLRVQDVQTEIHGMLATLVGYGKLHVDTAGHEEEFFMHGIAHPQRVRDTIMDQVASLHHVEQLEDRSGV